MTTKLNLKPLVFTVTTALIPIYANAETSPSVKGESTHKAIITHLGSTHYPPLEFINEDGIPDGYIIDIRKAIADQNDENLVIKLDDWNKAMQFVEYSEMASMAMIPTVARAEKYDFSPPFHYVAHAIFSPSEGPYYENVEQLDGLRIAVVDGAYAATRIELYPPSSQLVKSKTELECLQLVTQSKADVCVEGILSSNAIIEAHNLKLSMNSPPFWPRAYVFAVQKGNDQLLDRINNGLAAIVVNGTFTEIYEKWEDRLEWKTPTLWDQFKVFFWLLIASFLMFLVTFAWSRILKRKVTIKTLSLRKSLDRSRKLRNQLKYESQHDQLTGLLNREGFIGRLKCTIEEATKSYQPVTLLMVQMRNLYSIIISLGYEAGYETLINLSERLRKIENAEAVHLGSGLFALAIISQSSISRFIDEINKPIFDNKHAIEPELIFSSVTFNRDNNNDIGKAPTELLRKGVTALAYVRQNKIKYLPYTSDVEPDPLNLRLINDFYKSGCSNFNLVFQPQINFSNHSIDCFEALIRWDHPELGCLPPGKFITLFEKAGYIPSVTRWVISEAVKFLIRNENDLNEIKVSVNITNRDLVDHSFISFVKEQITQIPNKKIVFEITESEVVEDGEDVEKSMLALRKLGVLFAVDDYGTGFSSLSYLNNLPIDEIKIDKLFISNITESDRSAKIVRSTIDLAHQIGLTVVAEGVETSDQLAILQELECDRVQGYFFSKPLKEIDFLRYVKSFNNVTS